MKNKILFLLSASFVCFLGETQISADPQSPEQKTTPKGLYLCKGVWTTQPCVSPEASLPYHESYLKEETDLERDRKRKIEEILHPVRMKSSDLSNTYKARYDISTIESICEDPDTSIEVCREAVLSEHEKLLNYELKLREQELKKEEIKAQKETKETEVHIHNTQPPVFIGPRHGIHHPHFPRPSIPRPPIYVPQPPRIPRTQKPHTIPVPKTGQTLSIPATRK